MNESVIESVTVFVTELEPVLESAKVSAPGPAPVLESVTVAALESVTAAALEAVTAPPTSLLVPDFPTASLALPLATRLPEIASLALLKTSRCWVAEYCSHARYCNMTQRRSRSRWRSLQVRHYNMIQPHSRSHSRRSL